MLYWIVLLEGVQFELLVERCHLRVLLGQRLHLPETYRLSIYLRLHQEQSGLKLYNPCLLVFWEIHLLGLHLQLIVIWGIMYIMTQAVLVEDIGILFKVISKYFNIKLVGRTPPRVRSVHDPLLLVSFVTVDSSSSALPILYSGLALSSFPPWNRGKSSVFQKSGHAQHWGGVGSQNYVLSPKTPTVSDCPI